MALKDIFTMVKADRYTADGREEVIKAREDDVEDRRYNVGEISEKTGLQKTQRGWVKPKNGKAPGAKTGPGKGAAKPAEESKPAEITKFKTEQENSQYARGKEGWDKVDPARLPDIKKMVEQKIQYYKSYNPYSAVGKKTGLNAAQKKAVELNTSQAKENLAFFTGQLEGINEQMGASDSAPRVLTGDTRIRVRKA